MSSIAFFASPVNTNTRILQDDMMDHPSNSKETPISKKRASASLSSNTDKVNNILKNIHTKTPDGQEADDDYAGSSGNGLPHGFGGLPPPISMGSENTRATESSQQIYKTHPQPQMVSGREPLTEYNTPDNGAGGEDDDDDMRSLKKNYMSPEQADEYNKSVQFKPPSPFTNTPLSQNDILIKKVNYLIHMLEEQHDEKTNNVTEEVVLYSFLGVFVIFVVDSFVRVGKYTR